MAHDIDMTTGRPAMAYTGATPWHGLGTALANPFTAAEAIVAGGLDYDVYKDPVYVSADRNAPDFLGHVVAQAVPGQWATRRSDTGAVLGIVGDRYQVLQNRDAFAFMDTLGGIGFRYHTVGALDSGRRIWLLGKLDGTIYVRGADQVDKYFLLTHTHDGSGAVRVLFTPTRVVCANTLAVALGKGRQDGYTFRHTGDLAAKITQAQKALGLARQHYDDLAGMLDVMASARLTAAQLDGYFRTLYPDPVKADDAAAESKAPNATKATNIRGRLTALFESGKGQDIPETRRTVFSAYNAVTEYLTHERTARGAGDDVTAQRAARLESTWFGDGASLSALALSTGYEMAKEIVG